MEEALFWSSISNIVFNVILCCTAVTLNSVTIYALRKTPSVPMPLKVLLLSLAVSDLGVGILCHPLYIVRLVLELETGVTAFRPTFDSVFWFVIVLFTYASFFGVLSLSVDRFLALRIHLKYQQLVTQKRVMTVVISSWVLSGAIFPLTSLPKIPLHVTVVIIKGTCFLVSGTLNCYIYALVRRHANQIQSIQVHRNDQENAPDVANSRRMRKSVPFVFAVLFAKYFCLVVLRQ